MTRNLFSLILLLLTTSFVTVGGQEPKAYNKEKQLCCNGVVFDDSPTVSCCGSSLYNNAEEQCCGGLTHDIGNNNLFCCYNDENGNEVTYNKAVDICCSGRVWQKGNGRRGRRARTVDCCGSLTYIKETQLCCNENEIRDRNGASGEHNGCCVSQTYNTMSHMCCKHIQQVNGTKVIEFALIARNESAPKLCCGTKTFDPKTSTCCSGEVVQLPEDRSLDFICCGRELLTDPDKELCCRDKIHPKSTNQTDCCGLKTIYNREKHICCGQSIFSRTNVTMECCQSNGRLYDPKKEMCCRSGPVTLGQEDVEANRTSCCEVERPENGNGLLNIF